MEGRRERQASIHPTEAHSFVASKYCKWRKGSQPRKGSRSVAWLDGMVEILVSARKALEPTSYPRLQDFLDALQSLSLPQIPGYRIFWVRWVQGLDQWHGLMVWSRSWFRPAKLWSLHHIPGYRIS